MVSICGRNNSKSSYELASSDVFVKLSEHTSTEMSDFTVFVVVFLSIYLHLQSLKYYVAEMILGSRYIFLNPGSISSQSPGDVIQKLDQSKTFNFSLVKLVQSLVSNDNDKLEHIEKIKWLISGSIAVAVMVTFLVLLRPRGRDGIGEDDGGGWPVGLGVENLVILSLILALVSFGLSMFVVSVETPALPWIIFVSLAISTYAVIRTSKCNENRACLYKPDGESDNFLDFDYKFLVIALSCFVLKKILFSILFFKRRDSTTDKVIRGLGFLMFIVFYIFMILTTFISSPETKQNQFVPCTLKGSFVGQLIYWPLFLIIIFYVERGSYNTPDDESRGGEVNMVKWVLSVASFLLSSLLFLVPLITILEWQGNSQNKNARNTCTTLSTVRQPDITLDKPGDRCCSTQKISTESYTTFDVHWNYLNEQQTPDMDDNVTFALYKNGEEVSANQGVGGIMYTDDDTSRTNADLIIIKGTSTTFSKGESLKNENQIAMRVGDHVFAQGTPGESETQLNYELEITVNGYNPLFPSVSHRQKLKFLKLSRTSLDDNDPTDTEKVAGCTGRNKPAGINFRNIDSPILFQTRHPHTGAGPGALAGFISATALLALILPFANTRRALTTGSSAPAGFVSGLLGAAVYGGIAGAPAGALAGFINELIVVGLKTRELKFYFVDAKKHPIARVKENDGDDVGLNRVPLNDNISQEWKSCKNDKTTCNQQLDSNGIEISYTEPMHCDYLASFKLNFSNYIDDTETKYYQLSFNTDTSGADKSNIYFQKEPAESTIIGAHARWYWIILVISLLVITVAYFLVNTLFRNRTGIDLARGGLDSLTRGTNTVGTGAVQVTATGLAAARRMTADGVAAAGRRMPASVGYTRVRTDPTANPRQPQPQSQLVRGSHSLITRMGGILQRRRTLAGDGSGNYGRVN
jgi:hypothetical protein